MPLARLLPDLLAAERALGRLDQAFADPNRRHRARFDAARRTAAALIKLDGGRLDPHDHQQALAAPEHARGEAARAVRIGGLVLRLQEGLIDAPEKALPDRTAAPDDVVAAVRASVVALNGVTIDLPDDGSAPTTAPVGERLEAWTRPWLDALHRRWSLVQGGRPAELTGPRAADAAAALESVDQALNSAPGLLGAAAALRTLFLRPDPGPPERPETADDAALLAVRAAARPSASWWSVVAWLAGPSLIEASCRLRFVWPALTPALARDATGYRLALTDGDHAWTRWFLAAIEDLAAHELERVHHLDLVHERWMERLAPLTHRSTSRLPDLLPWLHERPAFTVARVADEWKARFGLSLRGAHLLTDQLAKAGVVCALPGPGGERIWATDLGFLPAGR